MLSDRLRLALGAARLDVVAVERLLESLDADRESRVVTLEGDGACFCEGLDLAELLCSAGDEAAGSAAARAVTRFGMLLRALGATPRPVIALVDGRAVGGGVGLAGIADLVLATPRATFGLPEALFGVVPAMVLPVLARRVGAARARWMAMSAASLSAEEAQRIGLVDEVVEDLEETLARHTRRLARLSPAAVAEVKRLSALAERGLAQYEARGAEVFASLAASPDARSRVARFLDGHAPWPDEDAS